MNFYVCVTTIKKYKAALDVLLESLPSEWKKKCILVYQDEPENKIQCLENHIEVHITNNISDYGNFIGINMLLERNIIPRDSWFLFIHDTCKFIGNDSPELTYNLIKNIDADIIWLSKNGQCNLCLIRGSAVKYGYEIYKDIKFMTKMETITYEWHHDCPLSPKSFNVNHHYIDTYPQHLGKRFVYNNVNERDVLFYESISIEKYFFAIRNEEDHPFSP